MPSPVLGQGHDRFWASRSSDSRSHGIEHVVVAQVPGSEFGSDLGIRLGNRWAESLYQCDSFIDASTRRLLVSHWPTSRACPEADLRVDLSEDLLGPLALPEQTINFPDLREKRECSRTVIS